MTENEKNMIAGLPFEAAARELGTVYTGLQTIQATAETNAARNLAKEALDEAIIAERHLNKAKSIIIDGEKPAEPSLTHLFMKLREALHNVETCIADEYASEDNALKLSDLEQAKSLLVDCEEIVERAEARAGNIYKGTLQPRVVLKTLAEFFAVDNTATTLRYCHIPKKSRK